MKKRYIMGAIIVVMAMVALAGCKKKEKSEEQKKIDEVFSKIVFYNTDDVRESLTLPSEVEDIVAEIVWSSDNENVISVKSTEKVPAGVVTRPDKDTKVTLTAKVTIGKVSESKKYTFNVKAKKKVAETTDYLFATFKHDGGPEGQQIWFSTSRDGNNWTDLNNDKAVLSVATVKEGDKGVRDPFLVRSPEGDKFYLIATDLCIGSGKGTHDWGTAQSKLYSSKNIRIWESTDLVNWSEPWLLKIGVSTSTYTWAPEVIWDEESKQYMIYWSAGATKDVASGSTKEESRTWYCMTRDFHSFTKPAVYASSINGDGMIDMSIVNAGNNTYYRISSSYPDMMIEVSKNGLFGDWKKVTSLQELGFNYGAAGNTTPGIVIVEGPEIFKYNKDDSAKDENGNILTTWGILVDNYGGVGYFPVVTTDMENTTAVGNEGCVWYEPEYDFSSPKRHGTILPITSEEYDEIMKKWGKSDSSPVVKEEEAEEPVLFYDFEESENGMVLDKGLGNDKKYDASLFGSAAIVKDEEKGNVLKLDGKKGSYLEFPKGFFDGRDTMTICMDVKSEKDAGNFFTFTYGKDSSIYSFLRIRGTNIRNAITKGSYMAESELVCSDGAGSGVWQNIVIVIEGKKQALYVDGVLKANATMGHNTTALGQELLAYLGKSFYGADDYFKGYFDNVKVYNRALSKAEIRKNNGLDDVLIYDITSENNTFVWSIDESRKTINLSFLKNAKNNDMSKVKLTFDMGTGAKVVDLKDTYNLKNTNKITIEKNGESTQWTIVAGVGTNPCIPGQYADPDIDYFNGKYYIYPTTDGFSGWSGYQFHCFSSTDLVNWVDEGIILDVKNNNIAGKDNKNNIPGVPWAKGNAWAPSIEEKNGKYYFYFCAKRANGDSCIGVAVANSPTGPFVAENEPLITPEIAKSEGNISGGQTIDPSIYTENGKSYMLFGNGYGAIVELGADMKSIVPGTMKKYNGTTDLRESIIVVKRNGIYHFTWSCDDTGSENYHVNYGTSDSLYGDITYHGTVLAKNIEMGILGTGHHSIVYKEDTDEYIIAYHRFVTPIGTYTSDFGVHREVCVDKLTFDEETGLMNKIEPTH